MDAPEKKPFSTVWMREESVWMRDEFWQFLHSMGHYQSYPNSCTPHFGKFSHFWLCQFNSQLESMSLQFNCMWYRLIWKAVWASRSVKTKHKSRIKQIFFNLLLLQKSHVFKSHVFSGCKRFRKSTNHQFWDTQHLIEREIIHLVHFLQTKFCS